MQFKGKTIQPPQPSTITIPRPDGDIRFVCGAVLSFEEFERLCPEPKPPTSMVPGKQPVKEVNSPQYKAALDKHSDLRTTWLVLTSMNATPDLTWDTVDFEDPKTWPLYMDEMKESFTELEISKVISAVWEANLPSDKKTDEALGNSQPPRQAEDEDPSSQKEEQ